MTAPTEQDLFAEPPAPPTQAFVAGDDEGGDSLAEYARRAYLEYALSVVKGRALPDVGDGQKPVQRRILYAMQRMGLAWGGGGAGAAAKPVKSARVVGDVLGRFHPHGDQAAYDALVRMAQDFSQRYPLIDGQGNFGSRDGDGAAAMRYTEARLSAIARLLLDEIDEGTVDFVPNYDGSTTEPARLPARLPFVLLNGASGIAVGLATEIPSHNLNEVAAAAVALIRDERLSDDELHALLPAPDFPGGAQIISSAADIREAYSTGRGSLKVRARWTVEDLARGQWQLVVTELPPGTSAAKVLEEIEELTNPKVKAGKKALTQDQVQLKASVLAVLDAVRDEAGLYFADEWWPRLRDDEKKPHPDRLRDLYLATTRPIGEALDLLKAVGEWGFGRDSTFGRGRFRIEGHEPERELFRSPEPGDRLLSLSHGCWTEALETPRYKLATHFGKLAIEAALACGRPWKRPILLMRPGATFAAAGPGPHGAWLEGIVHSEVPRILGYEPGHHAFHLTLPYREAPHAR